MKVCIVNNLYTPYERGGAETVVKSLVKGFKELGHTTIVITTRPYFINLQKINECNEVYYLPSMYHLAKWIPKPLRVFIHLANILSFFRSRKLVRIIKTEQPDVILGNNLLGVGYFLPKLCQKEKLTYIQVLHDIQLLHPSGLMLYGKEKLLDSIWAKIYQHALRRAFDKVGKVVSPSRWLIDTHRDYGFFVKAKSAILPNPVDIQSVKGGRKNGSRKFTILYVGRVDKVKGAHFLIGAYNKFLKNSNSVDTELILIGHVINRRKIEEVVGRNPHVQVMGWKSNSEVRGLMHKASCLVVPSLCYENTPTVILEAASYGLPVLASRIGGITETIHRLGGLLFEPGNQQDLIRNLQLLTKNTAIHRAVSEGSALKIMKQGVSNYCRQILELAEY